MNPIVEKFRSNVVVNDAIENPLIVHLFNTDLDLPIILKRNMSCSLLSSALKQNDVYSCANCVAFFRWEVENEIFYLLVKVALHFLT
jgi:hypothetical protein